jgi:glucokinase
MDSVGIGVPGTVDGTGRVVVNAPNLGWRGEAFARYFEAACGVFPYLVQDTRAAALAESRMPALRGKRCVACVTLGTGIGCGVVLGGHIWHGGMGTAGEIGHIPVARGGRACACGRQGCMEAYASGTGMAHTARERGVAESSEALFALADQGDGAALAILDEATDFAAMGIAAMVNVLSPDAVLLSGGLCAQRAHYVAPLMRKIRERAYPQAVGEGFVLEVAALGADAPVIGAAILDAAEACHE